MQFSIILREKLKSMNMTQKELAGKIGTSPKNVSSYLTGRTEPDLDILAKLCIVLNISIDELLLSNHKKESQEYLKILTDKDEIEMIDKYRKMKEVDRKKLNIFIDQIINFCFQSCEDKERK